MMKDKNKMCDSVACQLSDAALEKGINVHPMGVLRSLNEAKVDGSNFGDFPLKVLRDNAL
jgi:hypothetical protein